MTKTFIIDTNCFIDNDLFNKYFQRVSTQRQKKISRLVPKTSKRLSLGAGVALSIALERFGLYGSNAEIQYSEKGKPFLKNNNTHISISHSGHYAVAAVGTCRVGIDIEEVKSIEDAVIKRVTTRNEQAQIKNLRDFYRLWTAKECILKITGEGLSGGMENIDLRLNGNVISVISSPIKKMLYFKEYDVSSFCLTVCAEDDNFASSIEKISF
ncbi:MAG: 4'-phosphopantetheinyl transferase superfamily protein [Synergistaceae bacterium]|nr:4'-phosphopantetheinyl transferase superfamily protein [Synergistaceae bacterium]